MSAAPARQQTITTTDGRPSAPPPLRVGLMLRAVDDVDGQGIYIRKLLDARFEADRGSEYVAFYASERQAGRYAGVRNVREGEVPAASKLLWDKVRVPPAADLRARALRRATDFSSTASALTLLSELRRAVGAAR